MAAMRKILVALGVGVGLGLSCPAASSIQNFSAASNDRFANQAAFIGSGLDWSGVGRSSDGRWATMLTATVFLSANHYHPGIGSSLSFYPGNDPGAAAATRMVTGGQRIGTSDLWVGFLNMALPTAIAGYDFSRVAVTEANFVSSALCDQSVFMGGVTPTATGYGAVTATVQTVGENRLEGFIEDATDTSLSAVGDVLVTAQNQALDALYGYTLSGFEAQLNGGDSGSPLMLVVDGRLMLAGIAWAVGTADIGPDPTHPVNRPVSVFTYTGSYAADILPLIPEPATACMTLLAAVLLAARRRRCASS
jgi:hypothetical protein